MGSLAQKLRLLDIYEVRIMYVPKVVYETKAVYTVGLFNNLIGFRTSLAFFGPGLSPTMQKCNFIRKLFRN